MRKIPVVILAALGFCLRHADAQTIKALNGREIAVAELDEFVKTQMHSLGLPGLSIAVINGARPVYHRYLGLANRETRSEVAERTLFDAGSMSKTPFAFLVMRMAEKGVLDLDRPLHQYCPYPDIAYDDRYKLITARMVLCHTSGFPNWRILNKDKKLDIKFTPGTRFLYSGEGFEYLAVVLAHIKNISKNGLQRLFKEEVSSPLGMESAYFTWNEYVAGHQASGHIDGKVAEGWGLTSAKPDFGAAYSLQTEALSYARFLVAMMSGEGLSKESYEEMLKARIKTPDDDIFYGLGIRVKPSEFGNEYLHDGFNRNFSSAFMFNKEKGFGYVFFTNCEKGAGFNERLASFLTRGE